MTSTQALHPIEQSILISLSNSDHVLIDSLVTSTGLSIDQIRRGIEWLKFKKLILVEQISTQRVFITSSGTEAAKNGLPERKLVNSLKDGNVTLAQVLASGAVKNEEINAAIAGARRNQWIQLIEGKMIATPYSAKQSPEEIFLKNLREGVGFKTYRRGKAWT
jgi:phenylalanyl-tRNA synthetase alpha chain